MSLSNHRLAGYAKAVLQDEESMSEVIRRLSIRYFRQFRKPKELRPDVDSYSARMDAALKTDLIEDFFSELRTVLAETADLMQDDEETN